MVFQTHKYCQFDLENGCHMCDCSLFQVTKHITSALYVYECILISIHVFTKTIV